MAEGRDEPAPKLVTPGSPPKPGDPQGGSGRRDEGRPAASGQPPAERPPAAPTDPAPNPTAALSRPDEGASPPPASAASGRVPAAPTAGPVTGDAAPRGTAAARIPGSQDTSSTAARAAPGQDAAQDEPTARVRAGHEGGATRLEPQMPQAPAPGGDHGETMGADRSSYGNATARPATTGRSGERTAGAAVSSMAPQRQSSADNLKAERMDDGRDDSRAMPRGGASSTLGAPAATQAPGRGGGGTFLAAILGGIIGAAIVGLGGWYLIVRDRLPSDLAARVQALEPLRDRVAAVGAQNDVLKTRLDASAQDVGGLQSRVGQIEQTVRDLPGRVGAAEQRLIQTQGEIAGVKSADEAGLAELRNRLGAVDDLAGKVGAVQERVGGLDQQTRDLAGRLGTVGDLTQKQAVAAQRLDQLQAQAQGMSGLADRVAKVESDTAAQLQAMGGQVAAINQKQLAADALGARLDNLKDVTDKDRTALAATQAGIVTLQASTAAAIEQTQAGVTQALQQLQAKLEGDAAARERLLALSVTAQKLAGALDSGDPLHDEIGKLRELAANDPGLSEVATKLEPVADGVPTLTQLAESLPPPPTSAPAPSGGNASWFQQAGRNLTGLVSVAPSGEPVGPLNGRLEQARAALAARNLAPAIEAVSALARSGEQKAADWVKEAQRRQTAETALHDLQTRVEALATARS